MYTVNETPLGHVSSQYIGGNPVPKLAVVRDEEIAEKLCKSLYVHTKDIILMVHASQTRRVQVVEERSYESFTERVQSYSTELGPL